MLISSIPIPLTNAGYDPQAPSSGSETTVWVQLAKGSCACTWIGGANRPGKRSGGSATSLLNSAT